MRASEPLELDVRPIFEAGGEPFDAIMAAKSSLRPDQSLHLVAPFQPFPLYSVFKAEGYTIRPEQVAEGEWHIYFDPREKSLPPGQSTREMDLRHLEPPLPLQRALEALSELGRDEILVFHTRFHPVHFFEQIDDEVYDYDCVKTANNHWTTHIWRLSS